MEQLEIEISAGAVELHQVFGVNLFTAHAIDYIQAIREADGIKEKRTEFVRKFDRIFSVSGARFKNRKFELIDAINNALKHIRLKPKWYQEVEDRYGSISYQCLVPEKGRILCVLNNYRFDYVRVVLRPAFQALGSHDFSSIEDVLDFARGESNVPDGHHEVGSMEHDDPSNAIDRMIDYCNPICNDCGEVESDCYCAEYVYDGKQGEFKPRFDADFDFDGVMSQISGAYSR